MHTEAYTASVTREETSGHFPISATAHPPSAPSLGQQVCNRAGTDSHLPRGRALEARSSRMAAPVLLMLASSWLPPSHAPPQLNLRDRRGFLLGGASAAAAGILSPVRAASAFVAGTDDEVSGLVVLRVAEVCNFQEKLLRTIATCSKPNAGKLLDQFGLPYCGESAAYSVNPSQILFGTGLLLKNSNLDGNMKLMISQDVPRKQRQDAVKDAVAIMNTFNNLVKVAAMSSFRMFSKSPRQPCSL